MEKDKEEKKKQIDEEYREENFKNKDEMNFLKYEKLLDIKEMEKEIEYKQYLIDKLNYKYNKVILSLKSNYIIDICFTLQKLLHYIYPLNLNEEIPLLYVCNNLQLFKFEKEILVLLLEQNKELKLSHLFSLYEYFESLIFPEFIYHINNGYLAQIPLYLSKKILYIFDQEELRSNIIFTKIEFIEAIRKCISRYIISSVIEEDYITEELNMDLFELLLKEDLWGNHMKMINLKESFNYINNYIKFHLKVKHIFNLFEVLIEIEARNYFTFDNFTKEEEEEEEEDEEEDENYMLKFIKEKKEENEEEEEEEDEEEEEEEDSWSSKKEEYFDIHLISQDLKDILQNIKRRKNYIYKFIQKSKIIEKYSDIINKKDKNMNQNKYVSFKNILIEIMNNGTILNNDNLIKQFNHYIKKPKINIHFSDLSEKKNIINFGEGITNIILFNKNKIIVSFYNEQIKFYSFDRKTFREETIFKPLEGDNLKNIKNIDKVNCMKN